LRALNLKEITVLGTPTKYNAVSGFNIEITGFVNE
jgi:GTP cyclohydrolase II